MTCERWFCQYEQPESDPGASAKGIMVGGNSLHIMNKSFNNFILSIVDEDSDIKMRKK